MRKIFFITATLMLTLLTSCGFANKMADAAGVTNKQMNDEDVYKGVQEALSKVDPSWRVFDLSIHNDGVSDECKNDFGYCYAYMINADGEQIRQSIYPEFGAPEPKDGYERVMYDKVPELKLTAEQAMKNINDCIAMIPEGFKFLNLEDYWVRLTTKNYDTFETTIKINVQEIGKENIEVNGVKSQEVYYSLRFTIDPDGTISMKEA